MVLELVVVGLAVVIAFVVARRYPGEARKAIEQLLAIRTLLLGAFLLIFAVVLIFTGIFWLIFLGFVLLFLIALFVIMIREDGDFRSSTQVIREWL